MLKANRDFVIVEPDQKATQSTGGILLPDDAQERPRVGTVLAVGLGRRLDNGTDAPVDMAVGDKVVWSKFSGSEIEHEGLKLTIMRQSDVQAVIE